MIRVEKAGSPIVTLLFWWMNSSHIMLSSVLQPFRSPVNWCVKTMQRFVHGAKYAFKRAVVVFMLFLVTLWISVLLYASFYHMYVPSASITKPAHFKFRVCASGVGMCSFPVANVTLCSDSRSEVLGRGQQYQVHLGMEIPDSKENRDVGMFMVTSRLYDRYGTITQESSRSVVVKYQSDLLKTIQTIVLSPLYITGFAEQSQSLLIDLFDEFFDDYYQPSVGVLLEIHSRQLSFYSAVLRFHASYSGLRYYLFYFPLTSAFFGISFNFIWLAAGFMVTWYKLGLELLEGSQAKSISSGEACYEQLANSQTHRREIELQNDETCYPLDFDPDGKGADVETVPRHYIQPFTMSASVSSSETKGDGCHAEPCTVDASDKPAENGTRCLDTADFCDLGDDIDDCKLRQRVRMESSSS